MTRGARQGARLFVHVPRSRATVAAGLLDLNGRQVLLVRRSTFDHEPCWVVDPPLVTTLRQDAQAEDGRELRAGHQVQLPGLPEAWMTARAPTWAPEDLQFLREHYGQWTTAAIAEHLGRGLAATRSKVEDLHLRCRTVWTAELDEIVTLMFPDSSAGVVAELVGASAAAVRQRAMQLGVRKVPGFAAAHARATTLARSAFTPEISEIVELLYPDTVTQEIADLVAMPLDRVLAYANHKGWKKTPEFVRETARSRSARPDHPMRQFQFPKGHVPANKGVKGISYPGMQATQFKKGERSGAANNNWKPVGSYSVNGDGYLVKKVQEGGYVHDVWRPVHRMVWEAAHGPVPAGHVVRFKDGMKTTDPEKITVDVLVCITLAENGRRNVWHRDMPPELRKLVGTRIALSRMVNKRQKELEPT